MKTPKWCFFMSDNAALKAKQEAGFVHVSDSGKTKGGKDKDKEHISAPAGVTFKGKAKSKVAGNKAKVKKAIKEKAAKKKEEKKKDKKKSVPPYRPKQEEKKSTPNPTPKQQPTPKPQPTPEPREIGKGPSFGKMSDREIDISGNTRRKGDIGEDERSSSQSKSGPSSGPRERF